MTILIRQATPFNRRVTKLSPMNMNDAIHQARLDAMYRLLPCCQGKPKLAFDVIPDSHGQYCFRTNEITLNITSMTGEYRPNVGLNDDEFWTIALAHEYGHAYMLTTAKEGLAYREQGPAYIRQERDMDHFAAVLLLALASEEGFPPRDEAKRIRWMWFKLRDQYYFEELRKWSKVMESLQGMSAEEWGTTLCFGLDKK